jgi:iron complex outermembrane receptor protein
MYYRDQLIQTGEINDVGAALRQNVDRSYRAGLELQGAVQITRQFTWQANATLSRNKIEAYTQHITNYDTGEQIARPHENTDIAFSPDLIANSTFRYQYRSLEAAWTFKYVSRQYLDNSESKNQSIDPYAINDLRFQHSLPDLSPLPSLAATLQLNNVLNHMYETDGYTFGFISGGNEIHQNYYYPQAGRHFLLELRAEF